MDAREFAETVAAAGAGARGISENALTETLAFVLRAHEPAARAFAAWAANGRFAAAGIVAMQSVDSQVSVRSRHGRAIPDLQLRVRLSDGRTMVIRSEHKKGARGDPNQVDTYRDLPDVASERLVMAYLTANPRDISELSPRCDRAACWYEVADLLRPLGTGNSCVQAWVEMTHSVGRRAIADTRQRDQWMHSVCRCMAEGGLALGVPQPLRSAVRVEPRHWDRVVVYFGLRPGPFNGKNCDCVYAGFRVEPTDLGVPMLREGEPELILGVHTRRDVRLPPGEVAATTARLEALAALAPQRVFQAHGLRTPAAHFHHLVALSECPEDVAAARDARLAAHTCSTLLTAWMQAIFVPGSALTEAMAFLCRP
ncbi:MAG: hypothetical protein ACKVS8_10530 [Phycisphaerales bacterium]